MITMSKPPHKFFDKIIDNDLDSLFDYLVDDQKKIVAGQRDFIPKEELIGVDEDHGPSTQLAHHYNIFDKNTYSHPGLDKLKDTLRDLVFEASSYYGIDFNEQNYAIKGWYNLDKKMLPGTKEQWLAANPDQSSVKMNLHDHMGGQGAPVFHGYYCVNAEPSVTFYQIDRVKDFDNVNINNRAIVSETGHPHTRDLWWSEKSRITIAYDICPRGLGVDSLWVEL